MRVGGVSEHELLGISVKYHDRVIVAPEELIQDIVSASLVATMPAGL